MVLKGGRVAKSKIFKEKHQYECNSRGRLKLKNFCGRGMAGILSGTKHSSNYAMTLCK